MSLASYPSHTYTNEDNKKQGREGEKGEEINKQDNKNEMKIIIIIIIKEEKGEWEMGMDPILSHLHKHLPGLFLPNHQIPHLPLPPLERRSQLAVERTRARAVRGALEDLERG